MSDVVTSLGYTFVGLECLQEGRGRSLIRLYIDKPDGVTLEDCALVSRQVDAVMEVEAPIQGGYTLEVSSPGIDRKLFRPEDFKTYLGSLVKVRLLAKIGDRRNFKGRIHAVEEESVSIMLEEGTIITFSFADIVEARLVPQW